MCGPSLKKVGQGVLELLIGNVFGNLTLTFDHVILKLKGSSATQDGCVSSYWLERKRLQTDRPTDKPALSSSKGGIIICTTHLNFPFFKSFQLSVWTGVLQQIMSSYDNIITFLDFIFIFFTKLSFFAPKMSLKRETTSLVFLQPCLQHLLPLSFRFCHFTRGQHGDPIVNSWKR